MLAVLTSAAVWYRMSHCDIDGYYSRALARKSLGFSYSHTVNYRCSWCVQGSDADSFHIHSSQMWIESFVLLSVCPCSACNSIVVPRSVVCALQTISPPDSNDAFRLRLNDLMVAFVSCSYVDSPTARSWQMKNFYSVWIALAFSHQMHTLDWWDFCAMCCSSTNQMPDSRSSSWFDCSRRFWRFA